MNKIKLSRTMLVDGMKGMLGVLVLTIPMLLIGRDVLGEAVIGFLYLISIAWSATKWGRTGGLSAALTAALCFDFLFIPPFYTFVIGSLESWLMLVIFFSVAVIVVDWIQGSLTKAHEATLLYELTSSLANARTPDAVTHTVARYTRQLFQAAQVIVTFHPSNRATPLMASEQDREEKSTRPDRILPILNAWGLVGEIQIWRGDYSDLPAEDSPLLQGIVLQTARAFERTWSLELEQGNHPNQSYLASQEN
jgi:two-component system, OmpR family, sensor histidine kinase KdpD